MVLSAFICMYSKRQHTVVSFIIPIKFIKEIMNTNLRKVQCVGIFLFAIIFALIRLPVKVNASVIINEFYPKSSEWVEFYNASSDAEDLANYVFDDDSDFNSDTESKNKISLLGIVQPQSLCYWDLSAYLNDAGDTPTLFKSDGTTVDSYTYSSSTVDKSYSRIPDGGEWQVDQIPTKITVSCMSLAPTSTPTPSPTPIPTSTNTPYPTSTPTNKPTPTYTPTPTPIGTSPLTPTPSNGIPTVQSTRQALFTDALQDDTGKLSDTSGTSSGETLGSMDVQGGENQPSGKAVIITLLLIGCGSAMLSIVYLLKKHLHQQGKDETEIFS